MPLIVHDNEKIQVRLIGRSARRRGSEAKNAAGFDRGCNDRRHASNLCFLEVAWEWSTGDLERFHSFTIKGHLDSGNSEPA